MGCVALAPIEARELIEQTTPSDVRYIYYRTRRETIGEKILRKLGLTKPSQTLDHRMRIVGDDANLADVEVMWLSTSMWLPREQMSHLLDRMPKLRWVYSQATGTNHLDLEDFRRRNIMLSNVGRLNSLHVAEMALSNILAHAKRLVEHIDLHRQRRWQSLASDELGDLTIGIIGCGNIGGELARLCQALSMRVIGASRTPRRFDSIENPYDSILSVSLDLGSLLKEADFVVLTLPLTQETRNLIGPKELALMKPASCLINVSRGPIVDEDALCDALDKATLAAAFIDVPRRLRPPRSSRLYRTPGLILTHYSAANVHRNLETACEQFTSNLKTFITTAQPPNRVI